MRPLACSGHPSAAGWLLCAITAMMGTPVCAETISDEDREFFESKVRPILVEHCYECHSAESDEIEAGLVLDSRQGWQTGGDSGPAVVPGDLEKSLLVHAVRYQENLVSGMPPRSKLPDDKIAALERWIERGAPDPRTDHSAAGPRGFDWRQRYQQHWSWRPIKRPELPGARDREWSRSPLDRFVLARLESHGLRPAPPASKRTWLRRVHFDLIGLPPTRRQIERYLNDPAPDAEARVVDELLESPHFGEKWARHWLDLVRYADTYGHEFDYPIAHSHEYRDYVIRALNADVPYDQFVREHIAGDLMPNPRLHPQHGWNESVIGTGFWYLHEATHAPTDVLGNESDIIDNQIDVYGKTFLGLTVACARCHDHKFDAIPTTDYYALSAFLQGSCRQEYPLDAGAKIAETTARIKQHLDEALDQWRKIDGGDAALGADTLRPDTLRPDTLRPDTLPPADSDRDPSPWPRRNDAADSRHGSLFEDFQTTSALPDGWSSTGTAFRPIGQAEFRVDGTLAAPGTVDSSVWGDKQVGSLRSPTFEITATEIHVRMKATSDVAARIIIDNYQMMTFSGLLFKGTFLEGDDADTGDQWQWKTFGGDLRKYVGHKAYLEFVDHGDGHLAIDEIRFRDSAPPTEPLVSASGGIDCLQSRDALLAAALKSDPGFLRARIPAAAESIERAARLAAALPRPRFVLAMAEGTREDANVYIRGSHTNLGEPVASRFLTALGAQEGTRLELARRTASDDNPLTARVIVNRIWHHLFGRGIVATVDDFGPQGQPPSHPELLDWLASDLIDRGWSLKETIREIVLSSTYRQDSVASSENDPTVLATSDPTNRLLHRMPIRRLPAESIRDAILFVSGRFDPTPTGPGVPTYRNEFMSGRGAKPSGPLDGNGRRSIYLAVYRNFLNPFLSAFDMPSPFGPLGRRSQSNVPAQALTLMNDPLVVEQADRWAQRMLAREDWSDRERIAAMVEQAHATIATPEELDQLQAFLTRQAEAYGEVDHRGWADLAHALWNMKAFYFLP